LAERPDRVAVKAHAAAVSLRRRAILSRFDGPAKVSAILRCDSINRAVAAIADLYIYIYMNIICLVAARKQAHPSVLASACCRHLYGYAQLPGGRGQAPIERHQRDVEAPGNREVQGIRRP
jgi:hypothetical protein